MEARQVETTTIAPFGTGKFSRFLEGLRRVGGLVAESILVVEDDELMLAALEILLQDEGYEVTTASNGIEALLFASSQSFDLVISDVQMAEMDGIETISNLKKQQPGTRSIVIT